MEDWTFGYLTKWLIDWLWEWSPGEIQVKFIKGGVKWRNPCFIFPSSSSSVSFTSFHFHSCEKYLKMKKDKKLCCYLCLLAFVVDLEYKKLTGFLQGCFYYENSFFSLMILLNPQFIKSQWYLYKKFLKFLIFFIVCYPKFPWWVWKMYQLYFRAHWLLIFSFDKRNSYLFPTVNTANRILNIYGIYW